jgi:hypothetical protein
MLAKVVKVALLASAGLAAPSQAQTLLEHSAETRLQLDFVVADAALKTFLPAGWETDVATAGGAKDCNLRMIFVDRSDVTGPDGAPKGASQLVYLEVPVPQKAARRAYERIINQLCAHQTKCQLVICRVNNASLPAPARA